MSRSDILIFIRLSKQQQRRENEMEKTRAKELWYDLFDKLGAEDYDLDKWFYTDFEGTLGELADGTGLEVAPEERHHSVYTGARYDKYPRGNPNVWLELNFNDLGYDFCDRTDW